MNRIILSIFAMLSFVCTSFAQTEESFVYKKVTSQSDIVDGGVYVLVRIGVSDHYYASYFDTNKIRAVQDNTVQSDFYRADACELTIRTASTPNTFYLKVKKSLNEYVSLGTDKSGNIKTVMDNSSYLYEWTIEIDADGYAVISTSNSYQFKFSTSSSPYSFTYVKRTTTSKHYPVYLYRKVPDTPQIITIGETGYSTLCNEYALDFTNSNIKAYTAKVNDATNALELTQVYKVPAHNAVVLYSPSGAIEENIDITTSVTADDIAAFADNALKGTVTEGLAVPTDDEYYALAKKNDVVAFYPVVKGKLIPSHKAYIYLPNTETGQSKSLAIRHTDISTTINAVRTMPETDAAYNLSGQRVNGTYRGIVIRNGRKYYSQ